MENEEKNFAIKRSCGMIFRNRKGKLEMLKGKDKTGLRCIICGAIASEEHHCISGHNREKCDKLGLTVPLCHLCHYALHNKGHCTYKRDMQMLAENYYLDNIGSMEEWMAIFGENYV